MPDNKRFVMTMPDAIHDFIEREAAARGMSMAQVVKMLITSSARWEKAAARAQREQERVERIAAERAEREKDCAANERRKVNAGVPPTNARERAKLGKLATFVTPAGDPVINEATKLFYTWEEYLDEMYAWMETLTGADDRERFLEAYKAVEEDIARRADVYKKRFTAPPDLNLDRFEQLRARFDQP